MATDNGATSDAYCQLERTASTETESPVVKVRKHKNDALLSEGELSSDDSDRPVTPSEARVDDATCCRRPDGGKLWRQIAEESVASSLVDRLTVQEAGGPADAETSRGVEAYDFRASLTDPRPRAVAEVAGAAVAAAATEGPSEALLELRATEGGVRSRLGKRRREPEANLEVDIELARIERAKILDEADSETVRFARQLAERLEEPNVVLLAHVVSMLGVERCQRLAQMTDTVQSAGGLLTRDGSRRRSRGGVFLQLVKDDKTLSKAQIRSLFQPHQALIKRKNKKRRIIRKAHQALDKLEKALF